MNDARLSDLAVRLKDLAPSDSEEQQRIRGELIDLKLLLERILQRELADFLGAADSMIRSLGILEGEAFEQVRDLVVTLVGVVADEVSSLGPKSPSETADAPADPSPAVPGDEPQPVSGTTPGMVLNLEGETPSSAHNGLRTMSELLLGQILIDNDKITRAQLVAALKLQAQEHVMIGQALVRLQHVDQVDVDEALEHQRELASGAETAPGMGRSKLLHELTLGEILTRSGGLSHEDLERGLMVQRATGKRLGEALVELGVTTWERIEKVTRMQEESRSQSAWGRPGFGTPPLRLGD